MSKNQQTTKNNSVTQKQDVLKNKQLEEQIRQGTNSLLDIIAPAALEFSPTHVRLGNLFTRSFFVYTYPRYLETNWLSQVIDFDFTMDISMFVYPMESRAVMSQLRKKVGQLESTERIEREKGLVTNPELETAIGDIEELRNTLQRGELRLFQYGLYFTIYAPNQESLEQMSKQLESTLGGLLAYTKQALFESEQGLLSTFPFATDELNVLRNFDTTALSTTFPFTSSQLTGNEGILYGINQHNRSLILFDRFNLDNANATVFAHAGAGKSYAIKLESIRSLMLGTDVIVIDPENEYKAMCDAVGGSFLTLSLNSNTRINPFDLPPTSDETDGEDALRSATTLVHGLVSLMVGGLTPEEDSLLDKAIYEVYALKDITADAETHQNEPPLMQDLQAVLDNFTGAESLSARLLKYTQGTFSGLFTKPTNIDLSNGLVVFSVRDLEEQLRPIGMYMILHYIWNKVRQNLKKRLLVVDEAWWMMQYEDSARFLYSLVKRARKYYLGVTVISQDVEDFLDSKYGRSIINNSSLQILLKQSTQASKKLTQVFNLTQGERMWLVECDVGQGLFFAGQSHVAIQIVASFQEDQVITTNPQQILMQEEEKKENKNA